MANHLKKASSFLQHKEAIGSCFAAIDHNTRLLRQVRKALPSPLDEHCLYASLAGGVLTLTTDSPVWASRLRFFSPEIERAIGSAYGRIEEYRIRVQPVSGGLPQGSSRMHDRGLSRETAQHLMDAAAGIADSGLASALRRLAQAGNKQR